MTVIGRSIAKVSASIEELGRVNAVCYYLDRLLSALPGRNGLVRYLFVAQPVPEGPLLPPRRGTRVKVEQIDAMDPRLHALELDDAVQAYRRDQKALCFAAFQDEAIIGCLWFCLGPYDEDVVRCRYHPRPADSTAWDFGAYVAPAYRTSFAFARLWDEVNAYYRSKGIRWSLSRISGANPLSLRSHQSLGAQVVGTATFLTVFGVQLMSSSLGPRLQLSFGGDPVPEVEVPAPPASADGRPSAAAEALSL